MSTRRAEAFWVEKEKRWKISVMREGIRKCFTDSAKGRAGKHACEAKADRWLRTFETAQTFGDALDNYLADKARQISPSAYRTLSVHFEKHIRPYIPASRALARISPYDWQKIIDRFAEEGHTQNYTNQLVSHIKSFITYCEARLWEIIPIRPGQLAVTATKERHEKHALEAEQIKKLLALQPADFKNMTASQFINLYRLSLVTGLRRGELLGLKWSDITETTITIARAVAPTGELSNGKTANARRTIPQTDLTLGVLESQRAFHESVIKQECEWVFPDWLSAWDRCHEPQNVWNAWRVVRERIGASDMSVHELRHTFISLFKSDMPLALLKQNVGHSASMDTVGVYGHQTEQDLAKSQEIIQEIFKRTLVQL